MQQFDTFFGEVMLDYKSTHTGALFAETTFNHSVAASTCGGHAQLVSMGMETNDMKTSCACWACVSLFTPVHTCERTLLLVGVPLNTHVVRQFDTI